jgi:hypothetical protein
MCRTEGAARWVSEFAVCVLRIALSLIAGWLIGSWLSQPGDVKEAFSGRERWDEAFAVSQAACSTYPLCRGCRLRHDLYGTSLPPKSRGLAVGN